MPKASRAAVFSRIAPPHGKALNVEMIEIDFTAQHSMRPRACVRWIARLELGFRRDVPRLLSTHVRFDH